MLWLLLAGALLLAALSLYAVPRFGAAGFAAAFGSTMICLLAAIGALFVTGLAVGTPGAITGIFLGVFLRTAVPFLLSILLAQAFRPLADAGLFGMVLINFLVMLTVETILVVRIVHAHAPTARR